MQNSSNRYIIYKGLSFVFGVFLLAVNYNLFLLPNNLVVGGMSGLAIVFQQWFNWNATAFIYLSSIVLLLISYVFLGKETTANTVIGSLLYPLMISITSPICNCILDNVQLSDYLLIIILAGLTFGTANGIIYKMGYTTGGGDVIMQLLSKYLKITNGRANFMYSFVIIMLSGFTFGIQAMIYAIIILSIANILVDKIIVGISNSKVFFICTDKIKEIKALIVEEFASGFTILPSKSSFDNKKKEVLMVVVPNRGYHAFKNRILEIDPKAFFIINDCYEVEGGKRKSNLPFL